jgi:hypothetical protein
MRDPTPRFRGITNIISDVYVLLLPMPLVWGLKMPLRKRLSLMGLFAIGGMYAAPLFNQLPPHTDITIVPVSVVSSV